MAFRLVLQESGETRRRRLKPGENLVGSDPGCDIRIEHPSVSRHHAALVVLSDDQLEVADLGSRNGTRLDGERVRTKASARAGQAIAFGSVAGRIEHLDPEDAEPASLSALESSRRGENGEAMGSSVSSNPSLLSAPSGPLGRSVPSNTTASVGPLSVFALGYLPDLMADLAGGVPVYVLAQRAGAALLETLPLGGLLVSEWHDSGESVALFSGQSVRAGGSEVRVEVGGVVLQGDLPNQETGELFRPVLETVAALLSSARQAESKNVPKTPQVSEAPGGLLVELPDPPSVEPAVRRLYERARKVAASDVNVLILGESGTGKELLARFLHDSSARSEGPFVALNCAALPRDLQESELFGIEKGVATGVDARAGLFEQAHDGTLFLDEIGDMALEVQAKILRVLQEQEVFRLGGTKARRADVRVVSATHRDVNAMVQSGSFRTDLFHRIADWQAPLPPLRERPADIPNLAAYFLGQGAVAQGRAPLGFSKAALDALCRFHWPGNIRQLEREIARGLLFTEPGEFFDCDCLSVGVREALERESPTALATILSRAECQAIRAALDRADGDVPAAARHLEVAVSTLYRKIKLLGLEGSEERAEPARQ